MNTRLVHWGDRLEEEMGWRLQRGDIHSGKSKQAAHYF
jgi:hypothetical protein